MLKDPRWDDKEKFLTNAMRISVNDVLPRYTKYIQMREPRYDRGTCNVDTIESRIMQRYPSELRRSEYPREVAPALAAEALSRAADFMEERGHCQHNFKEGEAVCCATAILYGAGDLSGDLSSESIRGKVYHGMSETARAAMQLFLFRVEADSVCSWNNEEGRTKEECVAAMRAAARV